MRKISVSQTLIFLTVFALALSALALDPRAAQAQDDPIPIGIAVAQTSNVSLFGLEQVVGAQIAEEYFNKQGGINGRAFKLIFEDTAGDEAGAINAFNNLIGKYNVVGIVGPTLSQQAFAADPEAEKAGVPVIAPSNTAKGIPQIGKFIARVSAPVSGVAPNAVRVALQLNPEIKKVAVFFAQNDAFSKSETGTFQETVKNLNLELVTVQEYQTTDSDFTTQATAALALSPDLIIISGLAADGGNLVKQLRELDYKGLIVGGNGLNSVNMFPICGSLCDGVIVAQAYSYLADTAINNTFREMYKERQKKEPPQFSAQSFSAVQVFVEALISLDKKTPLKGMELKALREKLNEEILAGKYNTPLGTISFDPDGEIIQERYYVARIKMNEDGKTGQYVFIEDTAAAAATPSK